MCGLYIMFGVPTSELHVISHATHPRCAFAFVILRVGDLKKVWYGWSYKFFHILTPCAAHGSAYSAIPTEQFPEMIITLIVGFLLFYSTRSLVALEVNCRRAASMRIPFVRPPIDPLNILFQVFESHVWKIIDRLPVASLLPNWTRYARRGWYFKDKASPHGRYEPIWALVTPCDMHILVCDSEAVHEVFARRNDFIRPNKMYSESERNVALQRYTAEVVQSFSRCMVKQYHPQTKPTGQDIGRSLRPRSMRAPCRLCGTNRFAKHKA